MFAVENGLQGDPRLQTISDAIRVIPHFPKTGIMFQDITTLLLDPVAFKHVVDIFVDRYKHMNISLVAGVEARGFIFGPPIALAIGAKFVPLRKPGKLPGRVISEEYELEYGNDRLEMSMEAVKTHERALVIDDLVATGGTLSASINLLERAGAEVVECACVVGLPKFKGECRLKGKPLYVLVEPSHDIRIESLLHILRRPASKRFRCYSPSKSPIWSSPSSSLDQLRTVFPHLELTVLVKALEDHGIREVTQSTGNDDAKVRAATVLEALAKVLSAREQVANKFQDCSRKRYRLNHWRVQQQVEALIKDNAVLKRAVAIQHERHKDTNQQLELLKQLIPQNTRCFLILILNKRKMQVNNYGLNLRIQQVEQETVCRKDSIRMSFKGGTGEEKATNVINKLR
ncbi:hypothetical protein HID58_073697 [Brassica napus]|uniref:adenine phosphoribosyltransferase n=1 Tax=Brassica napus TaxID=3708 RepID=A0ABQ7Z7Y0_BRANA|nr:hypothetical protein HID58_073697 [Brassica napus]